jgi:hypothetical protein
MFFGIVPLFFTATACFLLPRLEDKKISSIFVISLLIIFCATLSVKSFSLWYILHHLPLFSAIRVVSRIDQVLLFPVAVLASVTICHLSKAGKNMKIAIALIAIPLLYLDMFASKMYKTPKQQIRERDAAIEVIAPSNLQENSIIFVAQRGENIVADELDAMWLALRRNVRTMNGYSGNTPVGVRLEFASRCDEIDNRYNAYAHLMGLDPRSPTISELKARVLLIGFPPCP